METMLIIIGIILAIILIFYVTTYNKFIRLENAVAEANSGIDIALLKRFDLISNLVETVRGYSKYESELLENITLIRSNINTHPEIADALIDKVKTSINMTVEAYPTLKASDQYLNLQKNLSNVEEHLQASRRLFNMNVKNYNNLVQTFPSSFIANVHNFEVFESFSTDQDLSKVNINF